MKDVSAPIVFHLPGVELPQNSNIYSQVGEGGAVLTLSVIHVISFQSKLHHKAITHGQCHEHHRDGGLG